MKKSIIAGVLLLLVIIGTTVGGGYYIWRKQKSNLLTTATDSASTSGSQLNVDTNQDSSAALQHNLDSQYGTIGSGTKSSEPVIDPTTFKQYDQYKNSNEVKYAEIVVGTGTTVTKGKKVAMYYKGWLTDGKLFDQSRSASDNGQLQPFIFTVGGHEVISGMEQGINGMKVGGKRLLIIPPVAGYGATEQSGIPANSVLIFEVELLTVQ